MRILILANNDMGLYKFRKELIVELLNQKHEIYISLPDGEFVRQLESMGCKFIDTFIDRRGINPFVDIKLLKRYRLMMKEINPDLVITYTIKPNIYGGLSARMANVRYVVNITGLGTAFQKNGLIKTIVITMYKVALRKVKVVFFENSSNRDEFIKYNICPREKMCVLNGAGVNTEEFPYIQYPHNDVFRFLFIGRVMKEKGVEELFWATKKLIEKNLKVKLDVVGPCEENYEKVLKQYEQEGWLIYHNYQEDVRPFIELCDCFILPSWHEGMANTNLECASSGRPIITSNIPGCREAVIDGKTGFLCESMNNDSVYSVMHKIIKLTWEQRKNMGIEGRKYMKNTFEKRNVINQTIFALEIK